MLELRWTYQLGESQFSLDYLFLFFCLLVIPISGSSQEADSLKYESEGCLIELMKGVPGAILGSSTFYEVKDNYNEYPCNGGGNKIIYRVPGISKRHSKVSLDCPYNGILFQFRHRRARREEKLYKISIYGSELNCRFENGIGIGSTYDEIVTAFGLSDEYIYGTTCGCSAKMIYRYTVEDLGLIELGFISDDPTRSFTLGEDRSPNNFKVREIVLSLDRGEVTARRAKKRRN
jgi:hypothetical protein